MNDVPISGRLVFDTAGRILRVVLNPADALAHKLLKGLRAILAPQHVRVSLGETQVM